MSWKSEVIQEKVGKLGGAYNSRVGTRGSVRSFRTKNTAPEREKARIK